MPSSAYADFWATLAHVRQQTLQRVASPTAILVSLLEPLATTVAERLTAGGLKVLRVGHPAAAGERIPVTMPQIVVIPADMRADDAESISERCVAVGAEILRVDASSDPAVLAETLAEAASSAMVRSWRRGTGA